MVKAIIPFLFISIVYAIPATNEALDKARAEDIEINAIHRDEISKPILVPSTPKVSLNVETLLTHDPALTNVPPQTTFARIIDDIFQIPITVLQSVAKLLTGPFRQRTRSPEESSKY